MAKWMEWTPDAAPSFETPGGYVGQAGRLCRASSGRSGGAVDWGSRALLDSSS
jgi:hypothetical protein